MSARKRESTGKLQRRRAAARRTAGRVSGGTLFADAGWQECTDIFNALMAIPNLIALLSLSGVVVAETQSYLKRMNLTRVK